MNVVRYGVVDFTVLVWFALSARFSAAWLRCFLIVCMCLPQKEPALEPRLQSLQSWLETPSPYQEALRLVPEDQLATGLADLSLHRSATVPTVLWLSGVFEDEGYLEGKMSSSFEVEVVASRLGWGVGCSRRCPVPSR